MDEVIISDLRRLYLPPSSSHKGQNGRLLVIGGSRLFHAAGLWACEIASKIVDMVYYASVPLNLRLMEELKIKGLFRNGIVVPRGKLEEYLEEADCVLIGPGMARRSQKSPHQNKFDAGQAPVKSQKYKLKVKNIKKIEKMKDEGEQTRTLSEYLLKKYPKKRWVIDGGALQEMEEGWIPRGAILTPHRGEFRRLFKVQGSQPHRRVAEEATRFKVKKQNQKLNIKNQIYRAKIKDIKEIVREKAEKYNCVILLKGKEDIICGDSKKEEKLRNYPPHRRAGEITRLIGGQAKLKDKEVRCAVVKGGNAGMTKGGTGDVLAGLAAAFYCKNEAFLSALAASFINKKAGESLFRRVGYYFNASDLLSEIPGVLKTSLQLKS